VSDTIRVLLADDDSATRAGVELALRGHGFEVCAHANSAEAAVECAMRERPDVCLLETELPGGGIHAAEGILASVPHTVVLMLSARMEDEPLFAALRAGARGCLAKDMDPARLPATLRGVLAGEVALPRAMMGRVLDEFRTRERGRYSRELAGLGVQLTPRERQVLDALDAGLGTADAADALGISAVTVRRHTSEILRKLGVRDRDAALRILREPPT
jgi:DNA-binding NarL/FixJ family response regulator